MIRILWLCFICFTLNSVSVFGHSLVPEMIEQTDPVITIRDLAGKITTKKQIVLTLREEQEILKKEREVHPDKDTILSIKLNEVKEQEQALLLELAALQKKALKIAKNLDENQINDVQEYLAVIQEALVFDGEETAVASSEEEEEVVEEPKSEEVATKVPDKKEELKTAKEIEVIESVETKEESCLLFEAEKKSGMQKFEFILEEFNDGNPFYAYSSSNEELTQQLDIVFNHEVRDTFTYDKVGSVDFNISSARVMEKEALVKINEIATRARDVVHEAKQSKKEKALAELELALTEAKKKIEDAIANYAGGHNAQMEANKTLIDSLITTANFTSIVRDKVAILTIEHDSLVAHREESLLIEDFHQHIRGSNEQYKKEISHIERQREIIAMLEDPASIVQEELPPKEDVPVMDEPKDTIVAVDTAAADTMVQAVVEEPAVDTTAKDSVIAVVDTTEATEVVAEVDTTKKEILGIVRDEDNKLPYGELLKRVAQDDQYNEENDGAEVVVGIDNDTKADWVRKADEKENEMRKILELAQSSTDEKEIETMLNRAAQLRQEARILKKKAGTYVATKEEYFEGKKVENIEAHSTLGTMAGDKVDEQVAIIDLGKDIDKNAGTEEIPVNPPLPEGIILKVQVGAFRNQVSKSVFNGLSPLMADKADDGLTRYTVGVFRTLKSAEMAMKQIKQLGYADAFLVGYKDGVRMEYDHVASVLDSLSGDERQRYAEIEDYEKGKLGSKNITGETPPEYFFEKPGEEVVANDFAEDVFAVSGLYYTIQLGVYQSPVTHKKLGYLSPILLEKTGGQYRYCTGIFNNRKLAEEKWQQLKDQGQESAVVVVYNNGQRINIKEADKLIAQGGDEVFKGIGNYRKLDSEKDLVVVEGLEVVYRVQLGVYKTPVSQRTLGKYERLGADQLDFYKNKQGQIVYGLGNFSSYEEAELVLKKAKNYGVSDAFITAYNKGERIPVKQAIRIEQRTP